MSGWGDLLKGKFKEVVDKSTGEKIMVDVNSKEYDLDSSGNIVGGVAAADGAEAPKSAAPTGFVFGSGGGLPVASAPPTFSFGVPASGLGAAGSGGGGGFSFGVPAASGAAAPPVFGAPGGGGLFGGFGAPKAPEPERRKRKAVRQLGRATGDVYVAGNGDCSQMGLGEEEGRMECAVPERVAALTRHSVLTIACGGMHTIALTQAGALWSWGCNDDYALGRDGDESVPELVGGLLSGQEVVAVSAGDCHSAALHADGRVFSWGTYKDSNGYIGYAPVAQGGKREKAEAPTLVPGLEGVKVTCIASGSNHTLAVSRGRPELYAWGCGEQGQLGRAVSKETRVAHLVPARPALTIGGGARANGTPAAAAGGNGGGALAAPSARALNANFTTYVEALLKEDPAGDWSDVMDEYLAHQRALLSGAAASGGVALQAVFGGSYHSFALAADGAVYAFGLNNMGQLGLGAVDKEALLEPRRVHGAPRCRRLLRLPMLAARSGRRHGGPRLRPIPSLLPVLLPSAPSRLPPGLDGKGVCMLSGGEHHSVALTGAGAYSRSVARPPRAAAARARPAARPARMESGRLVVALPPLTPPAPRPAGPHRRRIRVRQGRLEPARPGRQVRAARRAAAAAGRERQGRAQGLLRLKPVRGRDRDGRALHVGLWRDVPAVQRQDAGQRHAAARGGGAARRAARARRRDGRPAHRRLGRKGRRLALTDSAGRGRRT